MFKPKLPLVKNEKEVKKFLKKNNVLNLLSEKENIKKTYSPVLSDLYSLYYLIIHNKRTTILEFGSGWSSLVIIKALIELKNKYSKKKLNLRRRNLFELFILENEKKYLNITKDRINKKLSLKNLRVSYNYSEVQMVNYKGMFATEYKRLPLCNPDFIYLDGPDQFKIKNKINGFTIKHSDMMPMVSDILKFEYFLIPGCMILVDGRGANAKFLKDNLKRNWSYKHLKSFDQHLFILNDPSLGKINNNLIKFYRS